MRITRSASSGITSTFNSTKRSISTSSPAGGLTVESKSAVAIRTKTSTSEQEKPVKKRKVATAQTTANSTSSFTDATVTSTSLQAVALVDESRASEYTTLASPTLPFSLAEAKKHLIGEDVRFEKLFQQIELKTYHELENGEVRELNIFRSLVTSILGQQISWLAARSIVYKFSRLFFPSLPEKPDFDITPRDTLPFPTPHACLRASEQDLRSAGLSGAKVKYVLDISRRFAEGRLDVRRLVTLGEEDLIKELVEIKGVGIWTAQMCLMFSLRSPNIMPTGDLGVQRGMCIFFNSDREGPKVTARKRKSEAEGGEDDVTISSALPPSRDVPSLPEEGPSIALIKSRLSGKKAKGNVYLT